MAVIVNDIGEVNIDAGLIEKGGRVAQSDTDVVPLTNGCICCTLKIDLVKQVVQLAQSGRFDYILIEASGVCEPIPIAQTITMLNTALEHKRLPQICHLDNIIAVADTLRLAQEFHCGEHFLDRDSTEENIESLLIQQLEFCNTVIMNKTETVSKEECGKVKTVIHALSPEAVIVETSYGKVNVDQVLDAERFSYEKACASAGWMKALEYPEEEKPETLEYGIGTFVYYQRRPFDKGNFQKLIKNWPEDVIRTKGFLWFQQEPNNAYLFEQAGTQTSLSEDGQWIAAAPDHKRKRLLAENPELCRDWDNVYGDRMVKLVLIGQGMDPEKLSGVLDACLSK